MKKNNIGFGFHKGRYSKRFAKEMKKQSKTTLTKEEFEDALRDWVTFYRCNLHLFVEHYLEVNLHLFQKISLYLMGISNNVMILASRGTSKSWMLALFACCKCILYSNLEFVVVSSTKAQARIIINEKIVKQLMKHPMIANEILDYKIGDLESIIWFKSGSSIRALPCSDNARGNRCSYIIYEEFRLMDENIINSVFNPFLISRQVEFLKNDKYKHLVEEPGECYISSAGYKMEWSWELLKTYTNNMFKNKNTDTYVLAFDYLLSIYHNLKTAKQIEKAKQKLDEVTFLLEYENIYFGENQDAFFKYDMFKTNQILTNAFYLLSRLDKANKKKNSFPKKEKGEIRIISVDIALAGGKMDDNDNTIISCIRCIPQKAYYEKHMVGIISAYGGDTIEQTNLIRETFYEFDSDYLVLDCASYGLPIYDLLGTSIKHKGVNYPAFTSIPNIDKTNDKLRERTKTKNALPVIFGIKATQEFNSIMAKFLRDELTKGNWKFLVDIVEAENCLNDNYEEYRLTDNPNTKAEYEIPFVQTSLMVNETISLQYEVVNNNVRVHERSRLDKKDRYTSLSMGNFFIREILEMQNYREKNKNKSMKNYCIWN